MRFANAVKGAAVLTVGLIVSGCAVRVHPAAVVVDPIPAPSIVVERPVVDVLFARPFVFNSRPIVIEKKTTVVVNKPGGTTSTGGGTTTTGGGTTTTGGNGHHDNGNHYGQDKDKFSNPSARGDNGNHNGQDKKGGVAKND